MGTINGFSTNATFYLVRLMSEEKVFYNMMKVFHSFEYLSDAQHDALLDFCKQEDSKFVIENQLIG